MSSPKEGPGARMSEPPNQEKKNLVNEGTAAQDQVGPDKNVAEISGKNDQASEQMDSKAPEQKDKPQKVEESAVEISSKVSEQSVETDNPQERGTSQDQSNQAPADSGAQSQKGANAPELQTHVAPPEGTQTENEGAGTERHATVPEEVSGVSMDVAAGQEVELMETEDIASEETTVVTTETVVEGVQGGAGLGDSETKGASVVKGKPEYCYCGKGRNLDVVELQCSVCSKWFHKDCLHINLGSCIPFMMSYNFCCKRCNPNNVEMYSRKVPNFSVLCYVVLANLTAQARKTDPTKTLFSKDRDIIPFIDTNWELLTPAQRRTTVTWHSTIVKAMMKDSEMFVSKEKPDNPEENDEDYPFFGLLDQDLSKIGPNYDPRSDAAKSNNLNSSQTSNSGLLMTNVGRGRGAKKRNLDSSQNVGPNKKSKGELNASLKVSAHGYPIEHPYNKDGYRYTLTENDPHAPAALFDEDIWIGKPIPAHLYRKNLSTQVLLALHDRAPQLKVSPDRLTVTGEKGYSMVRATHSINSGVWFFEVMVNEMSENTATRIGWSQALGDTFYQFEPLFFEVAINKMPDNTAMRIGWSQALGNLQAPLGYDKFGYSVRSRKGTKFHQSRGKKYSEGYTEGDVIGCMVSLPKPPKSTQLLPDTYKNRTLIKFKSHLYFEEKDEPTETEKHLKVAPGSKVTFYKNGVCLGTAFEDIYDGMYYPTISLYKNCSVSANFGPTFKHPPKDVSDYRAISELAEINQVEQTLSDAIFHVEHEKMYEDAARGILVVF